jgi:AcrR family transcriptional regulator
MSKSIDGRRVSRLPRSQRRAQLLDAAQRVFVANGYHSAAMDDIAERAGVSKPVLYQHFPSKLDLYLALLETQAETIVAAIKQALARTDDNRERIHGVLCAYFDFVSGKDNVSSGAYRLVFETDLGNDPGVRERVERAERAIMNAVADTVEAETGLGRLHAELIAITLTGAAQVAARWWLSSDRPVPKDIAVSILESLLWRGISEFPVQLERR